MTDELFDNRRDVFEDSGNRLETFGGIIPVVDVVIAVVTVVP